MKNSRRMGDDGIPEDDLQVVSGERDLENLDPKERAKQDKRRKLIRAGMGAVADDVEDTGFEVAKANSAVMAMMGGKKKATITVDGLETADDREYGSDQVSRQHCFKTIIVYCFIRWRYVGFCSVVTAFRHASSTHWSSANTPPTHFFISQEAYDDEDRAKQLALGTMMLRKHRAKDLVDAAYNRFSWNDDADLPDWFADDEKRHYRPQLPLPPGLVEQMKQKFMTLATKPIKKVAEARARKRKRATQRLAAAKKKATAMAANPGTG